MAKQKKRNILNADDDASTCTYLMKYEMWKFVESCKQWIVDGECTLYIVQYIA